jgi:hypothetical protein
MPPDILNEEACFATSNSRQIGASSGTNDFIQSFDDLSQFLRAHFPESLADPFNRQRADLANLHP